MLAAWIDTPYPHSPTFLNPFYVIEFDLAVVFRRYFRECPWRLTRLLYFSAWTIGIDISTSFLHFYPPYGLLNLLQPTHRRLLELPICNHGIARHGPYLVLEWKDTILILRRRRHFPPWPRLSLSKLRTRSDPPVPQVFMQQGSRPRILTLLPSSFLSTLLALTSLSYFTDAFTSAVGD